MDAATGKAGPPAESLRDILLALLQAGGVCMWPGVDGLTVDDVLRCYPAAIAAGKVPDWPELQRRYPALMAEIQKLHGGR